MSTYYAKWLRINVYLRTNSTRIDMQTNLRAPLPMMISSQKNITQFDKAY